MRFFYILTNPYTLFRKGLQILPDERDEKNDSAKKLHIAGKIFGGPRCPRYREIP
jgi:hypothetical protein